MPAYIVSYDLIKDKNYKRLTDELLRLDAHKALLSVWLVNLNNTAKEVRDHLRGFMDDDDKIIVAEITSNSCAWKAFTGTQDWLDANT